MISQTGAAREFTTDGMITAVACAETQEANSMRPVQAASLLTNVLRGVFNNLADQLLKEVARSWR